VQEWILKFLIVNQQLQKISYIVIRTFDLTVTDIPILKFRFGQPKNSYHGL
jgi:hypothetical protein